MTDVIIFLCVVVAGSAMFTSGYYVGKKESIETRDKLAEIINKHNIL